MQGEKWSILHKSKGKFNSLQRCENTRINWNVSPYFSPQSFFIWKVLRKGGEKNDGDGFDDVTVWELVVPKPISTLILPIAWLFISTYFPFLLDLVQIGFLIPELGANMLLDFYIGNLGNKFYSVKLL